MEKWNQIQTLSGSNKPYKRSQPSSAASHYDYRLIDYYGFPINDGGPFGEVWEIGDMSNGRTNSNTIHIIDENTFVVGAPNWNYDVRFKDGAIYIYTKSNGIFYESQFSGERRHIDPNNSSVYAAYFGYHLDSCIMNGTNYLFVGAPGEYEGYGRVFIFTKSLSDNKYYQHQLIYGNKNSSNHWAYRFGSSFQIDKENYTLVIGSPGSYATGTRQGNVHIFTESNNYWYEHQILYNTLGLSYFDQQFGIHTAISGNIIVASKYTTFHNSTAFNLGSVHIFTQSNTTLQWDNHQDIFAPNPVNNDYFGFNLDFKKDNILITRPGPTSASINPSRYYNGSSVYLYTRSIDNYWYQNKIFYKPPSANSDYGMMAKFDYSGTNIWVGCMNATASINPPTSSTIAGRVGECYVYNSKSSGDWDLILQTNPIANSAIEITSSIISLTTPGTIVNSCYIGDFYKDLMVVSSPYTHKVKYYPDNPLYSIINLGDHEFAIKVFSKSPVVPPTPCTLPTIDQDFVLNHYICNIRQNTDVDGNAITTIPYGLSPYGLNLRRFGRVSPLSSSFD